MHTGCSIFRQSSDDGMRNNKKQHMKAKARDGHATIITCCNPSLHLLGVTHVTTVHVECPSLAFAFMLLLSWVLHITGYTTLMSMRRFSVPHLHFFANYAQNYARIIMQSYNEWGK